MNAENDLYLSIGAWEKGAWWKVDRNHWSRK